MDKKKLLIYAHYYAPDVASTGQILQELAEGMKDAFDITVICVVPSYTGKIEDKYKAKRFYIENLNGIRLIRIRVPEFSKSNKKSRIKNIRNCSEPLLTAGRSQRSQQKQLSKLHKR